MFAQHFCSVRFAHRSWELSIHMLRSPEIFSLCFICDTVFLVSCALDRLLICLSDQREQRNTHDCSYCASCVRCNGGTAQGRGYLLDTFQVLRPIMFVASLLYAYFFRMKWCGVVRAKSPNNAHCKRNLLAISCISQKLSTNAQMSTSPC